MLPWGMRACEDFVVLLPFADAHVDDFLVIAEDVTAHSAAGRPARPWLLADIGGTNARFGWLGANDSRVAHVSTLRGADHAGPAAAARAYLDGLSIQLGRHYQRPRGGAFAVATALCGDEVGQQPRPSRAAGAGTGRWFSGDQGAFLKFNER